MRTMRVLIKLSREQRGATAVEYGLICALIVLAMLVGLSKVGGANGGTWGQMANKVSAAMT